MSQLDEMREPTNAELWVIELESEVLAAELALLDAEAALFGRPTNGATARYLQALLDVVDLRELTGSPALVQPAPEAVR